MIRENINEEVKKKLTRLTLSQWKNGTLNNNLANIEKIPVLYFSFTSCIENKELIFNVSSKFIKIDFLLDVKMHTVFKFSVFGPIMGKRLEPTKLD